MKSEQGGLIANWACEGFANELFSPTVVLPLLVVRLGGDAASVGVLTGIVALAGPSQLLSTWYLEGTPRRWVPLCTLAVTMLAVRLVMLLVLWYWAVSAPEWVLSAVFVLFFLQSVLGALSNPVQLELSRQLVGPAERTSFFALRGVAGDASSLIAGGAACLALASVPFPENFILLAALTVLTCTMALASLLLWIREPSVRSLTPARESALAFLRSSRDLLLFGRDDAAFRRFRRFVWLRQLIMLSRCAFPFMAVYAVARFGVDEQMAGAYLMAITVGRVLGGALLSTCGRRLSDPRQIMQIALACAGLSLLIAVFTPNWAGILVAFLMQGVFMAGLFVACPMLSMVHAPPGYEVRGMSLAMVACHPLGIVMPIAAGALMNRAGFVPLAAAGLGFAILASVGLARLPSTPDKEEPMPAAATGV